MKLTFAKLSTSGNDFILFDNRDHALTGEETDLFRNLCRRRFSVGADGVLLVEPGNDDDVVIMRYFNANGHETPFAVTEPWPPPIIFTVRASVLRL